MVLKLASGCNLSFSSRGSSLSITLQKKERERLKERAENWKRIEALAAENPDMEAIAKQLQSMNLKPSVGAVVSIDDILVDDTGGGNGNNGEDEPNDIAAKVSWQIRFWPASLQQPELIFLSQIEEETSATAATSKPAKTPSAAISASSSSSSVKPPVADKPLLRRKSELPTDVYTQVSEIETVIFQFAFIL